ncbi:MULTISPECIES: antibiotic biosynthesis monooxygenase [unclassified Oleiphilus]|jgi:heme-degrading monooxygenase HmoA|uniref:antibiotic biosynthesis monooxygenase family protein n=2 Tax=Oleiphilus TaxID=141450 RepID=UPI0007C36E1A|nr:MULTISPECIES: antibiotic biosynthesis monooxygenase [unclassified Oleiphilus]KZY40143.1 antibiotic biosynthesis monooxygenase [Oleiphilus sp. HI0050]KZY77495.1 antibiotic biosynthesis monooxygenase [Oleiphilus sp. HI0069]KZY85196.1 antibiotic biosynthesis monooxygenase [Oleiphilus sp. HI0072]KZZ19921.1 antibiotic biosynthesis monooxygenase [Oleiphilus sp. HI0078]KZZ22436.1 antibiotic biosynthesis monooxygenase [Oleiphilus sp. HI0081]KZZ47648.1 antibiotic biosynthesis monooxygenase [Oleiphi
MIRVIIERSIAESLEANYEDTAKQTLQKAIRAPGFISGESLKDITNSRHRVILCNWRSTQDWQAWQQSHERKEMMDKLNLMLEREEKVTVLEMP